jgi:hypothetical protein
LHHQGHPVGDVARLAELGQEQFVLFDRASSYHELTQAMFLEAAIAPPGVMELDNVDSTKSTAAFVALLRETRSELQAEASATA